MGRKARAETSASISARSPSMGKYQRRRVEMTKNWILALVLFLGLMTGPGGIACAQPEILQMVLERLGKLEDYRVKGERSRNTYELDVRGSFRSNADDAVGQFQKATD